MDGKKSAHAEIAKAGVDRVGDAAKDNQPPFTTGTEVHLRDVYRRKNRWLQRRINACTLAQIATPRKVSPPPPPPLFFFFFFFFFFF